MKSVFIAGSRKFSQEIQKLQDQLESSNIPSSTSEKSLNPSNDTPETEKSALLKAFQKIEYSDICYVYSGNGYIGNSVSMEMAYAHSRKKEIISSCKLSEFSAQALVSCILSPAGLVRFCSQSP